MRIGEKIRKAVVAGISAYNLLSENDHILVAVSGGKDSTVLALMLAAIQRRAKINFTFTAVLLDQKLPGFNADAYRDWLLARGIVLTIITEDTFSIVKAKNQPGKSVCGLCSRLRRGILYSYAVQHGFTKIALGHHREDLSTTLMMNLFHAGRISAMPAWLRSDDGRNIVIRPMCQVPGRLIEQYADELGIPVIPGGLCGFKADFKRGQIEELLDQLDAKMPGLLASLHTAQKNIRPSQLLDKRHFPFNDD